MCKHLFQIIKKNLLWNMWILVLLSACENNLQTIMNIGKKNPAVETAKEVTANITEGGKLKSILVAPVMIRGTGDSLWTEFPNHLWIESYDSIGRVNSSIKARYGKYNETAGIVLLRDSVAVINTQGDTLLTSELWWSNSRSLFYTDKPVQIRSKTGITNGIGLEADGTLKNKTIFHTYGYRVVTDSLFQ